MTAQSSSQNAKVGIEQGAARLFIKAGGVLDIESGGASDPTTVVRVILQGAQTVSTNREPTGPAMPAFGWQLDDAQVAAVATYVRDHFNKAPSVDESEVRKVRADQTARTN